MRARNRHKGAIEIVQQPPSCPPRGACQPRARPKTRPTPPFDARARSQSGAYVIFVPYSFAIKQRPLRRACLTSASVVPGASGSEVAEGSQEKPGAPLKPFPPQIISSKTGAAPIPTPSADTAGSCRIARATMMGFGAKKLQRHQRTGTMRKHICRSANVFDHGLQVGGLSGKIIAVRLPHRCCSPQPRRS